MKVLIVNDGFPPHSWGGANTIAYLHAKSLRERGFDVRVFSTEAHYHPRWWAYRSLYNPPVLKEFKRAVREFCPDIVHFHNIHHYISYHAIVIAKRSEAKVFLTAHDVMSFAYRKMRPGQYRVSWWQNFKDARMRYNPLRNFIIRQYLKKVDQIFAVSEALKQALAANGIASNVSVVHNGIDIPTSKTTDTVHPPTALFVGRFTPDKGRDVLLKAFAVVSKTIPDARLLVVGFDSKKQEEPAMERLIDELDLRDKIIFIPSVPHNEIYKQYEKSDCVVVPSIIFDSFPTVNLEAMAAGKPVIVTCFGGSREAVEDGITGFIVDPRKTEELAKKILWILQNPTEALAMGARGSKRLEEHFVLEHMIGGYLRAYQAYWF